MELALGERGAAPQSSAWEAPRAAEGPGEVPGQPHPGLSYELLPRRLQAVLPTCAIWAGLLQTVHDPPLLHRREDRGDDRGDVPNSKEDGRGAFRSRTATRRLRRSNRALLSVRLSFCRGDQGNDDGRDDGDSLPVVPDADCKDHGQDTGRRLHRGHAGHQHERGEELAEGHLGGPAGEAGHGAAEDHRRHAVHLPALLGN
mmetsp:Transcript_18236/g.42695  ORF Transcript_18236/g.42695 Transcript_18236/m.42695 type:complete len:201 (+) Transcript_18236:1090-1692(+)